MHARTILVGALCLATGSTFGMHESLPFINADDVHGQGIAGYGVTVAVIDTGIFYDHPGLARSIAPGGLSYINNGLEEVHDGGADIWGMDMGPICP